MIPLKLCRSILLRLLVALVIISTMNAPPAFCQETEDSQVFIVGFNAYQQEAARYLSQFSKEYPDSSLDKTVEDELLSLTARYEKGEKLPVGSPPIKQPDRLAAAKAKEALSAEAAAETERIALAKIEKARQAEQKTDDKEVRAAKSAYREKTIGQFKTIIDKFPASSGAITAAAKLRGLGVAVALLPKTAEAPPLEDTQVLRLEVAQFNLRG